MPHGPVFPAYAFHFDTEYGWGSFSGVTRYSSNLVEMAHGTDLLVHRAIDELVPVAQEVKHFVVAHYADLGTSKVDRAVAPRHPEGLPRTRHHRPGPRPVSLQAHGRQG